MPVTSILLLLGLVAPPQDSRPSKLALPKGETKKAAVEVQLPAPIPRFDPPGAVRIPAPPIPLPGGLGREFVPAPAPAPAVPLRTFNRNMRRLTLEQKMVDPGAADANDPPALRGVAFNIMEMALASENFDRWIFEDPRSDEARRSVLTSTLAEKIQELQQTRSIHPDAVRKLRLAGAGDIKRFFDRVEAARLEFETIRQSYEAGRQALNDLEPLANEYKTGPFGTDSLFEKTLRKIDLENETAGRQKK